MAFIVFFITLLGILCLILIRRELFIGGTFKVKLALFINVIVLVFLAFRSCNKELELEEKDRKITELENDKHYGQMAKLNVFGSEYGQYSGQDFYRNSTAY